MGISYHPFQFLRYSKTKGPFGAVATLGRQGLSVPEWKLRKLIDLNAGYQHHPFCENILTDYFGASKVESFDSSDYEDATFVFDMNKRIEENINKYDTVIDSGTLEHIFNVKQAFENISNMCRVGGQIIHILPANNHCGHGFWQFSPELFFSLYSEKHGYAETEVFLVDNSQESIWFKVRKPERGLRISIITSNPVYLLCRTKKMGPFSHENVQQSDYESIWENGGIETPEEGASRPSITALVKRILPREILSYIKRKYMLRKNKKITKLSKKHPYLIEIKIGSLL